MTIRILLFLILLCMPLLAFNKAQIDSLNNVDIDRLFTDINQTIRIYRQAVKDASETAYPAGRARALIILGKALYLKGNYDESIANYLEAIRIFEKLNMTEEIALSYGDLGYQMKRRDLTRADKYMRKGIRLAEEYNLNKTLRSLYDNYGVIKEMESESDSALYFYQKSLQIKNDLKDSIGIPFSLNNIAGILGQKGQYNKAAMVLHQSDRYRQREKGGYGRLENMVVWGDLYFTQGQYDSAENLYRTALAMPEAKQQKYLTGYCYERLTTLFENEKNFKNAYLNQKQFHLYQDSLNNIETKKRIARLEIEFETKKKEHLILVNQLKIAERDRQLLILGLLLFFILISSWMIYKYQRQKQQQILKEAELNKQIITMEYQQQLADERIRISQELHDNIGSQLAFMISTLDYLLHQKKETISPPTLDNLRNHISLVLTDLRNTVWVMQTEEAGVEDLLLKLQDLKTRFFNAGNGIHFELINDMPDNLNMKPTQMLNLIRITQEAMQNIVKHAQATKVIIKLMKHDEQRKLVICDDGIGIDLSKIRESAGIKGMKRRASEIGGKLEIVNTDSGTEIICYFNGQ